MINDTSDFFEIDDFAEYATVAGRRMKVIFDKVPTQYTEGFSQITSHTPQITCQTVDLAKGKADQGKEVVVRKVKYVIVDIEDDGTGISTVFLHEAQ